MADTAQHIRQLSIKSSVVRRYFKEEQVYRDEVTVQQKVVSKLKEDGADGADIRAAERVLKDSEMMVPNTRRSLEKAMQALEDLVDGLHSEPEVVESQQYKDAFSQMQQVETAWKADGN
ncbi:MAG: hypothetical protein TREMPRED_005704 [Tremellales sp. Tagirdzhanova-0007]|nr:MAG: hypothetical protein TREMPRED_005704 [Tremellales sp. Tagirdzhanova-0007]